MARRNLQSALAAAGGERENPETVRWLLVEASADMDSTDAEGATALHLAVLNSHEGTTRVLLTHGADRLRPDSAGRTPLDIAATISSRAQGTLGTAPSALLRMMREADPSPGLVLALYSERERGCVAASLAAQAREHGLRDRAMALGTRLRVQDRDGAKSESPCLRICLKSDALFAQGCTKAGVRAGSPTPTGSLSPPAVLAKRREGGERGSGRR